GQHREMLDQVLRAFSVTPDYDLDIMETQQTLSGITTKALCGLQDVLLAAKPDVVLVHGDTTTTFTAALAAFYQCIPVGHVEAGLRSFDRYSPYPEEINRCLTGTLAEYHFAPTEANAANLARESKPGQVFITGNTVIDALKTTVRAEYVFEEDALNSLDFSARRIVLMTAHRRENLGTPMRHMFTAIRRVVDETPDVKLIYPMHMNPSVRDMARNCFSGQPRIHMIEPMDVLDFHNVMARAYLIMTDSGGIQEEAPSLGKPVLVMRDTTERPEGVEAGTLRLVGTGEQPIYDAVMELLRDPEKYHQMEHAANPYGDGHASEYIAQILEKNIR
ncbi:MAG: UDP-N-acetylglucosamine 2-epimerase (non-hydrolyzing), partial [Clostridia bacterium]|nr:UDP-N-acetylglucosamine 2-epimerase (non-hydrolyzing) [Clostridia bacterium]